MAIQPVKRPQVQRPKLSQAQYKAASRQAALYHNRKRRLERQEAGDA